MIPLLSSCPLTPPCDLASSLMPFCFHPQNLAGSWGTLLLHTFHVRSDIFNLFNGRCTQEHPCFLGSRHHSCESSKRDPRQCFHLILLVNIIERWPRCSLGPGRVIVSILLIVVANCWVACLITSYELMGREMWRTAWCRGWSREPWGRNDFFWSTAAAANVTVEASGNEFSSLVPAADLLQRTQMRQFRPNGAHHGEGESTQKNEVANNTLLRNKQYKTSSKNTYGKTTIAN